MTSALAEDPSDPPPDNAEPVAPPPLLRLVSDDLADTTLDDEQLGSRIVGLSGRIAAATCRWLLLVAEFDRREACAGSSPAAWCRSFACSSALTATMPS